MTDPLWNDLRDAEQALDTTVSLLRTGGIDAETVAAVLLGKALELWREVGYSEQAIENMLHGGIYVPIRKFSSE